MSTIDTYVAKLTEASSKKAREELGEKDSENRSLLKQFVLWLEQHNKWITAPHDPVFVMTFLRVRKFSPLLARETLVNYLTVREKESQFFRKVDCDNEVQMTVLQSGFFLALPRKDKEGRQVCLLRPGQLDVSGKSYKIDDVFKTVFMILDYLLLDEDVQVNGFIMVLDYSGVTMKHHSFAGDARQKFLKLLTKTYPLRLKGLLMYNVGPFMEIVLGLVKAAMREKIQKRVETDSTMLGIYEKIGQSSLPREYLPDDYEGESSGYCKDIIENLIKNLQKPEIKKFIAELSSGKYRVDESKMPKREEIFQEAFRKLNIE